MADLRKHVFWGTFVHCKSREELEYLHNAAVCVDSHGKIVRVDKDCGSPDEAGERLLKTLGWDRRDVDFSASKEGQFFFPGFIGRHISRSTPLSLLEGRHHHHPLILTPTQTHTSMRRSIPTSASLARPPSSTG
ncbi:hypothetical protein G7046_g6640 [Stylonectria norvegica]|nr:hypothetical protein G7046_g6640 [Stylonectria norvegica]